MSPCPLLLLGFQNLDNALQPARANQHKPGHPETSRYKRAGHAHRFTKPLRPHTQEVQLNSSSLSGDKQELHICICSANTQSLQALKQKRGEIAESPNSAFWMLIPFLLLLLSARSPSPKTPIYAVSVAPPDDTCLRPALALGTNLGLLQNFLPEKQPILAGSWSMALTLLTATQQRTSEELIPSCPAPPPSSSTASTPPAPPPPYRPKGSSVQGTNTWW